MAQDVPVGMEGLRQEMAELRRALTLGCLTQAVAMFGMREWTREDAIREVLEIYRELNREI